MRLKLFNTLTKQKELFTPINSEKITMYVCGPTVYSAPHLGNGLSIIIFDILFRLLIHIYGSKNVSYVRNITDVDDKINDAAKDRSISISELTKEVSEIFFDNTKKLGCLEPSHQPKVTDHIKEIIDLISLLIKNGFAYERNGHIYFEINKYDEYGKIAGKNIDELISGARVEINTYKKNPADFVLWKPSDEKSDPSSIFESPFGKGRPGWHIECSAMSNKYLGKNFDIHGGGVDLVFPHHTNEIAQSCAAFKGSTYANFWVHNGFLTVNGEKMSKSLGNFVTIQEILENGIKGEVIRLHLISSHYRKPVDWNAKGIDNAKKTLDNFYRIISILDEINESNPQFEAVDENFLNALLDDLNTPSALKVLHEISSNFNKTSDTSQKKYYARLLKNSCNLIGILQSSHQEWFQEEVKGVKIEDIEKMIADRSIAKKNKNFILADEIKNTLLSKGVILEDNPDGLTIWRKK